MLEYFSSGQLPTVFPTFHAINVKPPSRHCLAFFGSCYRRRRRLSVTGSKEEEFEEHAKKAMTLPEETSNDNKLILYGLYKQATVGPITTTRPGMFNMRDRAKWDAWKAVEVKTKEDAMGDYITKAKQLLEEAAASA
ncbi:hypothetical protein SAY87_019897 [Trapa incisa]|uniref:ACB domain-containing protein n=1 Tax=Trapa incisa TaxID=236973 RepID=A0AAN7Q2W8_9MYRT|nr:hypothetical protein SAY87_019897 [Trapa incisa]